MQIIENNIVFIEGIGFNSNIYLVGKNEIGIIDTGASPNYITHVLQVMEQFELEKENVQKLILTHIHPDHTGGVAAFIDTFDPIIYMHKKEAPHLFRQAPPKLQLLEGGETIAIDGFSFEVVHTPGHSPGGICLYEASQKILFSGDTVFSYGNIGRVDLPYGSAQDLITSIEKLLKLDVEFLCPGHMPVIRDGNKSIKQSYNFAKMVG